MTTLAESRDSWQAKAETALAALEDARADLASVEDQLEHALTQRDEAVDWGKRLTDKPGWVG